MSNSARDRIAERVKNAYAAGYNDGRKGLDRNIYAFDYNGAYSSRHVPDRMDEVAATETGKILEVVREAVLSSDALYAATYPLSLGSRDVYAREMAGRVVTAALDAAFGADDDGGER